MTKTNKNFTEDPYIFDNSMPVFAEGYGIQVDGWSQDKLTVFMTITIPRNSGLIIDNGTDHQTGVIPAANPDTCVVHFHVNNDFPPASQTEYDFLGASKYDFILYDDNVVTPTPKKGTHVIASGSTGFDKHIHAKVKIKHKIPLGHVYYKKDLPPDPTPYEIDDSLDNGIDGFIIEDEEINGDSINITVQVPGDYILTQPPGDTPNGKIVNNVWVMHAFASGTEGTSRPMPISYIAEPAGSYNIILYDVSLGTPMKKGTHIIASSGHKIIHINFRVI
jgi:hypothetical protein